MQFMNPRDPLPEGLGGPVARQGDAVAVDHPQTIGPWPHNLPPNRDRPAVRDYQSGVSLPGAMPSAGDQSGTAQRVTNAHNYAKILTGNFVAPTTATSDQLFLPEPATRRNLLILRAPGTNPGDVSIGFGALADAASVLVLTAGTTIIFDDVVPQDDLYALGSAAGCSLNYGFSTIVPE